MAYYSTRLDPVAQAMSECLQAEGAAALAVQASAPIVLYSPLTLKVLHAYMSPARQLSCMTVLLSQPHNTIEHCVTFNPATLLLMAEDGNPKDCVAKTDKNYGSQS